MEAHEQQQSLVRPSQIASIAENGSEQGKNPRSLKESAPSLFWRVILPAHLLLVPVAYIALISIVLSLNDREQSSFGDNVLQVLQIASTLWPLSFAAVMGPFLKILALYRAERGSTLGSLEFLLTSQTTMAALKNFVTIRNVQTWTVGIVLAWGLSPLGGQAAVRSLSLRQRSISLKTPAIYYLGSNVSDMNVLYSGTSDDIAFNGASSRASLISDMRSAISASFFSPDILASHSNGSSKNFAAAVLTLGGPKNAASLGYRDQWRNVRIPFLELLPSYNTHEPNDWVAVPSDMVVPYASLIGLPIRGGSLSPDRAGNSTLVVQSHYQTLSCGQEYDGTEWIKIGSTKLYPPIHHPKFEPIDGVIANTLVNLFNDTETLAQHLHFFEYPVTEPSSKLELTIGGYCENGFMMRRCKISTSFIDVQISCTRLISFGDLNCRAERVRHTPNFPIAGNMTALSNLRTAQGIIKEMPIATARHHIQVASSLESYLRDPPMVFDPPRSQHAGCFSDVPSEIFQARLATTLNTVIMAMYNLPVLTGADGISLENRTNAWKNTTADWSEFTANVYGINQAWFFVWSASTLVLLTCAAASIVVRCRIRAPDFLESVVGLTRDSPFINIPHEGSGMSACDTLRAVKDVKIKICDVKPDEDVGRIALTTEMNNSKLGWNRMYS
ncbi:hypothetical protein CDD83_2806 [Cordyceps sp. RAO-2017]|nr:hypothetical protein CDD83_2806 [Cordyceps sp. RAO-2017]